MLCRRRWCMLGSQVIRKQQVRLPLHCVSCDPPPVGYPLRCLSCDHPPIVGRLCELVETPSALASRTSCQDLDDYLSKLEEGSGCSQGQAGTLSWTPDENTPDTVYYQVSRWRGPSVRASLAPFTRHLIRVESELNRVRFVWVVGIVKWPLISFAQTLADRKLQAYSRNTHKHV